MRSEKVELRLPHDIIEEGTRRAEEEGHRNFKRHILALIIDDIIHPRHHCSLSHTIANADPKLQDRLLDMFLKITREGLRKIVIQAAKKKDHR